MTLIYFFVMWFNHFYINYWIKDLSYLFYDHKKKLFTFQLYHQSHSIPGPLDIGMFNYLTEIDINRVPIHMIQGLQKLRITLQHITINRSLQSVKVRKSYILLLDKTCLVDEEWNYNHGIHNLENHISLFLMQNTLWNVPRKLFNEFSD